MMRIRRVQDEWKTTGHFWLWGGEGGGAPFGRVKKNVAYTELIKYVNFKLKQKQIQRS